MRNPKRALLALAAAGAMASGASAQTPPKLDFVIVDNLGHLPMIVGAEEGIFKQHGVDVQLKIVKSGSEIVKALKANEVQGGGYMAYMMVSTFQDSVIKVQPELVEKFAIGLAAAAQAVRQNRDEAIEIFARVVPGVDVAIAKKAVKHVNYDPRISKASMQAFDAAQNELIKLGSGSADKKLALNTVVLTDYMKKVEQTHPQYFKDLKKVGY